MATNILKVSGNARQVTSALKPHAPHYAATFIIPYLRVALATENPQRRADIGRIPFLGTREQRDVFLELVTPDRTLENSGYYKQGNWYSGFSKERFEADASEGNFFQFHLINELGQGAVPKAGHLYFQEVMDNGQSFVQISRRTATGEREELVVRWEELGVAGRPEGGLTSQLLNSHDFKMDASRSPTLAIKPVQVRFAYLDDNNVMCGLNLMFDPRNPAQWMLSWTKHTDALPEGRETVFLSGCSNEVVTGDAGHGATVSTSAGLPEDFIAGLGSPIIQTIVRNMFTPDGAVDPRCEAFNVLAKYNIVEGFEDNNGLLEIAEQRPQEILQAAEKLIKILDCDTRVTSGQYQDVIDRQGSIYNFMLTNPDASKDALTLAIFRNAHDIPEAQFQAVVADVKLLKSICRLIPLTPPGLLQTMLQNDERIATLKWLAHAHSIGDGEGARAPGTPVFDALKAIYQEEAPFPESLWERLQTMRTATPEFAPNNFSLQVSCYYLFQKLDAAPELFAAVRGAEFAPPHMESGVLAEHLAEAETPEALNERITHINNVSASTAAIQWSVRWGDEGTRCLVQKLFLNIPEEVRATLITGINNNTISNRGVTALARLYASGVTLDQLTEYLNDAGWMECLGNIENYAQPFLRGLVDLGQGDLFHVNKGHISSVLTLFNLLNAPEKEAQRSVLTNMLTLILENESHRKTSFLQALPECDSFYHLSIMLAFLRNDTTAVALAAVKEANFEPQHLDAEVLGEYLGEADTPEVLNERILRINTVSESTAAILWSVRWANKDVRRLVQKLFLNIPDAGRAALITGIQNDTITNDRVKLLAKLYASGVTPVQLSAWLTDQEWMGFLDTIPEPFLQRLDEVRQGAIFHDNVASIRRVLFLFNPLTEPEKMAQNVLLSNMLTFILEGEEGKKNLLLQKLPSCTSFAQLSVEWSYLHARENVTQAALDTVSNVNPDTDPVGLGLYLAQFEGAELVSAVNRINDRKATLRTVLYSEPAPAERLSEDEMDLVLRATDDDFRRIISTLNPAEGPVPKYTTSVQKNDSDERHFIRALACLRPHMAQPEETLPFLLSEASFVKPLAFLNQMLFTRDGVPEPTNIARMRGLLSADREQIRPVLEQITRLRDYYPQQNLDEQNAAKDRTVKILREAVDRGSPRSADFRAILAKCNSFTAMKYVSKVFEHGMETSTSAIHREMEREVLDEDQKAEIGRLMVLSEMCLRIRDLPEAVQRVRQRNEQGQKHEVDHVAADNWKQPLIDALMAGDEKAKGLYQVVFRIEKECEKVSSDRDVNSTEDFADNLNQYKSRIYQAISQKVTGGAEPDFHARVKGAEATFRDQINSNPAKPNKAATFFLNMLTIVGTLMIANIVHKVKTGHFLFHDQGKSQEAVQTMDKSVEKAVRSLPPGPAAGA